MRISDWSSDVCSSDLVDRAGRALPRPGHAGPDELASSHPHHRRTHHVFAHAGPRISTRQPGIAALRALRLGPPYAGTAHGDYRKSVGKGKSVYGREATGGSLCNSKQTTIS